MITASPRLLLIIRLARPLEPIVPTSKPIGLRQWIWRAFVRSALIPLVLVETAPGVSVEELTEKTGVVFERA